MKAMIAAAALVLPAAAMAAPIRIDFTGTISAYSLYNQSLTPIDLLGTLPDFSIFGSLDIDSSQLAPPAILDGIGFVQSTNGSLAQDFIQGTASWAGGVFSGPTLAEIPNGGDGFAGFIDLPPYPEPIITFWDGLISSDPSPAGDSYLRSSHFLSLKLEGLSLPFPDLATPFSAESVLTSELFSSPGIKLGGNLSQLKTTLSADNLVEVSKDGYMVDFQLDSVAVRPVSVPEPATLTLFGIALAALAVTPRTRRRG